MLRVDEVIQRGDLGRDRHGKYFTMNPLAGSSVYDGLRIFRPMKRRKA
jgi:hypothetical protein